nr:hypothetical protein [Tanacetum cinerariifolium]
MGFFVFLLYKYPFTLGEWVGYKELYLLSMLIRYHRLRELRDIGYLVDVEVDPRETRVERVALPAMPEDIPKPTQEGAAETTEGIQREQGRRIFEVESAVIALTERVAELERDNQRLRGTVSVESERVDRL